MSFSKARPLVLVGAGKMGGAMLTGWIASGIDPQTIVVIDPAPSSDLLSFAARKGFRLDTALPAGTMAGVLLLALKPQMMASALDALKPSADAETLVISIAAGTPSAVFEAAFGETAVVRVMPNTPSQVGRGMSVAFANARTSEAQRETVDTLLAAIGASAWIETEDQMDAVTAVSGSGPAYVFYLTEALAAAGVKAGLPEDLAMQIARQTVCGAGELMYRVETPAEELRRNVTSPNGTTAAALAVLMADDGLQPVLDAAVAAARKRSKELAG
ncbi:pyrroline-5-carboxylate reductase [Stappia sp. ES.058]|uniref:pyrroline-5-carboxylate reductase n=1 Tax=Stappia sp. ES.058 TaxID=1881061 RepID=UPI00087AEC2E|nr:pyrroline-5-carboxylate reductase [Stappia sp. ES.058]SDU29175.1 pyrroline-5-carboxylate reductase [Stappia sp. ES.058]